MGTTRVQTSEGDGMSAPLPPGWSYSIDVLSDLLRDCEASGVPFERVVEEARRRNLVDTRDAIARSGEDGP